MAASKEFVKMAEKYARLTHENRDIYRIDYPGSATYPMLGSEGKITRLLDWGLEKLVR